MFGVKFVQADGRDLVECLDVKHGTYASMGGPSGPQYLRRNVRRWRRFRRSSPIIYLCMPGINGGRAKTTRRNGGFFVKKGTTLSAVAFAGEKEGHFEKNVELHIEMWRKSDYNTKLYVKFSRKLS